MKKTLLALALLVVVALGATEPPKMLDGFNYTVKTEVDNNGITFNVYRISEAQYLDFKKTIMKSRVVSRWINRQGLLYVVRKSGDYEIMSARGFGFKRFYIYEAQ
jgi:hypothetical protein